jgi:hypothetical protein
MQQAGSTETSMHSSVPRRLLVVAVIGIIVATLTPTGGARATSLSLCLVCGQSGAADVFRNVLLFLPLGLALGGLLRNRRRAILLGGMASLMIETLQFLLPGRDPSISDLTFNTLGTALGVYLAHSASSWLLPPPRRARGLALLALFAACGALALGGYLLGPGLPGETYYGQWTPELKHLEHYRGQVISARIGDLHLPSERLANTGEVRALLRSGAPIRIEALAGPAPTRLAPIFSINTEWRREVLLIGVEGYDAVFRYRTRAAMALLEHPELRIPDAFQQVRTGEPLSLAISRSGNGFCMDVNDRRECQVGFSAGDIGTVLVHFRSMPPWLQQLLGLGMLAALFLPAGFWIRTTRCSAPIAGLTTAVVGLLAWVGLAMIPPAVGLLSTTPAEYLAAFAGIGAGLGCGAWCQRAYSAAGSIGTEELGPGSSAATITSRHRSIRA